MGKQIDISLWLQMHLGEMGVAGREGCEGLWLGGQGPSRQRMGWHSQDPARLGQEHNIWSQLMNGDE